VVESPQTPRVIVELEQEPLGMVTLRLEWLTPDLAAFAHTQHDIALLDWAAQILVLGVLREDAEAQVLLAEVQATSELIATRLHATQVGQPSVDLLGAVGMVAPCWHAIATVSPLSLV
jgi:hypothetical protein